VLKIKSTTKLKVIEMECDICDKLFKNQHGLNVHKGSEHFDSVEERFWDKVDKQLESGCWEWQGALNGNGYGNLSVYGRCVLAHRFSYELKNGETKNHILHKCHNPKCVNPQHLYEGDQRDNINDMIEANRGSNRNGGNNYMGEKSNLSDLSKENVIEIKRRYKNGEYPSSIVDDFDVTIKAIEKICYERTWTHIQLEDEDE
jgi:hypothetical protein